MPLNENTWPLNPTHAAREEIMLNDFIHVVGMCVFTKVPPFSHAIRMSSDLFTAFDCDLIYMELLYAVHTPSVIHRESEGKQEK